MVSFNFKPHFKCIGNYKKKRDDYLVNDININEEYIAAHRTNSYIEILDKVEAQLRRKSLDRLTSSASLSQHTYLSESVLEPQQETISLLFEGSNLHPLIIAYFRSSFEACNTCALLIRNAHQVRNNYKIIQGVIGPNGIDDLKKYTNDELRGIFDELASFSNLNNPLLMIKPAQFRDIHNSHGHLLRKLTSKFRNNRRKATLTRYCPEGIALSFGLLWRNKLKQKEIKTSLNEELEVAAKGVYIMINEFDTMSRIVKRLQNETEHIKTIADMCEKNGKSEALLHEVIQEFRIHQTCFLEQLEELEEHIYLCFLTINRSRVLVLREIMVLQED